MQEGFLIIQLIHDDDDSVSDEPLMDPSRNQTVEDEDELLIIESGSESSSVGSNEEEQQTAPSPALEKKKKDPDEVERIKKKRRADTSTTSPPTSLKMLLKAKGSAFTLPVILFPTQPPSSSTTSEALVLNKETEKEENNNHEHDVCVITQEPIGSATYTTPFYCHPQGKDRDDHRQEGCPPVLALYPHLKCMQISSCGHYFDARALVVHFMHNAMNCPLCRKGNGKVVLDASKTFPDSSRSRRKANPWLFEVERKIQAARQQDEEPQESEVAQWPSTVSIMAYGNLHPFSYGMVGYFWFHSSIDESVLPVQGMRVPLYLDSIQSAQWQPSPHRNNGGGLPRFMMQQEGNVVRLRPLHEMLMEFRADRESLR